MADRFLNQYFGISSDSHYSLEFSANTKLYDQNWKALHSIKSWDKIILLAGIRKETIDVILSNWERLSVPWHVNATSIAWALDEENVDEITQQDIDSIVLKVKELI